MSAAPRPPCDVCGRPAPWTKPDGSARCRVHLPEGDRSLLIAAALRNVDREDTLPFAHRVAGFVYLVVMQAQAEGDTARYFGPTPKHGPAAQLWDLFEAEAALPEDRPLIEKARRLLAAREEARP